MPGLLTKVSRYLRSRIGRPLVRVADGHRNRWEWIEAVVAYRRALAWMPWREDLNIQIGNSFKEYGDYRSAMTAYSRVTSGAHRSDALREMTDLNSRAGAEILPFAIKDQADRSSAADRAPALAAPTMRDLPNRIAIEQEDPRRWLGRLGRTDNRPTRAHGSAHPAILFDQVGALSIQRDGAFEPLFTAVVAVRVRIFCVAKLEAVELWMGSGKTARLVERVAAVPVPRGIGQLRLHVANIWIDSATLPAGRHWLSIRAGEGAPEGGLFVNVAEPGIIDGLDGSDSYTTVPADGDGDLTTRVLAQPAQQRPAVRSLFDRPIRSILALRADQLGDVSASLPALARLRGLFPDARLVALVQPGVRGVVEASGLADEVLTIKLDYDAATERRHLSVAEEERVRALLGGHDFDLAIDLSPGDETRPLLLLAGATYLVGFDAERFPFLDYGINLRSRDKVNQLGKISHAVSVMTLIESLAVAVDPTFPSVPRRTPSEAILARHGLQARDYVVLHTGARHAINQWPGGHFLDLAGRLLAETHGMVVIFAGQVDDQARQALEACGRVKFFDVIDSDDFDAIVANARLMVGNDSGPKHLAATRGVPTVSIHIDRLNWNEWGQHGAGVILSKRVPCTGCVLNDIELCGREAACVRSITVDEVLEASRPFL